MWSKGAGKWGIVFVIFGITALFGCNDGTSRQSSQAAMPPPEVTVVVVEPRDVTLSTTLPGRVAAYRTAEIRPQVSGLLLKRFFKEGSEVKAGDMLYLIDPAPFKAALENAEAALAKAQANLPAIKARAERYEKLRVDGAISQQDYDDAVSALKQAQADIAYWKAQVEKARIDLGYCYIRAPISGRIGKSFVTEGAVVTAYQSQPLAVIHQLDPVYVDVTQSTVELLQLKRRVEEGILRNDAPSLNNVTLILEDGTTYPHAGTLQFRDVSVDPTTGSVVIRIVFNNPDRTLLPGMFVRATVNEGTRHGALLVPQEAVMRDRGGNPYCLVVNQENRVEMRMLQIDRAVDNLWLVTSGIAPGDRVIVDGLQFVRAGMVVKPVLSQEEK
ncbi:efflux RND transporter periplasmic adaptor subunit [Thermodesulforhabdus norvegica]|uniref:Membrane fusion protein, multidrug efflux system n=1 Tax=Thermodesulforhabdus norvegica TaxID=39841 RepID=A0A1I4SQI8_9BACT|nr:efflux RND transporter periplasmic adaptor subunit [Thermodesulforhabdus norvegica]SFM66695.1 membrane fusion protein, multidrug efflux system [Thermodesulforhabdus norvegica]